MDVQTISQISHSRATSTSSSSPPAPLIVTLSMEVSYPFHSHLIGRSGHCINNLMEKTGTRIHLPDRNRIAGHTKSNIVVVRGAMAAVEDVRQRIRAIIPVEFVIECRSDRIESIGQSSLTGHFNSTYGVLLRFYPKIDGLNCQVNVRGQQENLGRLKEAVQQLCRVTHTVLDSVVMKMETSFDHVWLVRDHIEHITSKSGAGIRLPDVSSLKELPKKYSIWIRGSMDAVYTAGVLLNAMLPLQLLFQARSDQLGQRLMAAAQELDVLLHVEPAGLDRVNIRLTSYERNARNSYELVRLCLELPASTSIVPSLPGIWKELAGTHTSFVPASKKLQAELSLVKQPRELSGMVVSAPESPQSSSYYTSSSTSSSVVVPSSLAAARFDPNSFRRLSQLLETIGLSHYAELFLTNEVDLAMFTTLTDQDLASIGIASFGARKIMLNAIQELRQ